jgi:superfamily II RNA helicase
MTSLLLTPDATAAPAAWPPAEGLALPTAYELDPFQKHAVLGIHAGHHVFVTAKTGSGKTFVGEYLIARALAAGKRVFYTTPIKSLSNQKYHDLKVLFPAARIGILTGDIKMCPDADVVVMTAEILRNLFYKRGTATESVGLSATVSLDGVVGVVMDEVHYIQDPDRGHVWEESMILCPRDLQLVLLSATMPSAAGLAGWLAELHGRPTVLVGTTHRVVPLVSGVLRPGGPVGGVATGTGGGWRVDPYHDTRTGWRHEGYRAWLADRKASEDALVAHRRAVAGRAAGDASVRRGAGAHADNPMGRLRRTVAWLRDNGQLPALCFVFSRRECERLAAGMDGDFLEADTDAAGAASVMDFHLSRHRAVLEHSPQYHQVRALALRGIGFHHSGLQPLLKEIVEILFARGFIRLLFATETFAVGLNMPTKTVIFLELSKVAGDGTGERRLLRTDEYLQMAGRAGRRGKDTQGLVLYEPMRDPVDLGELQGMVCGSLPRLESRMRFHYDFLLKRALTGGGGRVAEESYWAAQQRSAREALRVDSVAAAAQSAAAAAAISAEEEAQLTEFAGLEGAVATSKNAAQRRARTALERWLTDNGGPRWELVRAKGIRREETAVKAAGLAAEVERWDAAPLLSTGRLETCLTAWNFLGATDAEGLTPLGTLASDINEGHAILMPLLAMSGRLDSLAAEELPCVLAAFIREGGGRAEEAPTLDAAGLRPEVLAVLDWIDGEARRCQRDEDVAGVLSPPDFWDLSALWTCVAARWQAGAGLPAIAAEFGLFEGNVMRGLLKIANLLEEWAVLCELRRDLAGLERVRGLRFLREELVVDSLYLRL